MRKAIQVVAVIVAAWAVACTEAGASVVIESWGGDYVTASKPMVLPTASNPSANTWTYPYSSTTAINPTQYPGPRFYGALQVTNTEQSTAAASWYQTPRVVEYAAADRMRLLSAALTTSGGQTAASGLIFFQKADFTNGMNNASAVVFDSTSTFSMTMQSSYVAEVRLAVMNDGQWYLSQAAFTSATISLTNLAAQNFGAWNISSSSVPLPGAPTSFTTLGSSLGNIQAVGFYFTGSTSTAGVRAGVDVMTFNVTAIPEPAAGVLFSLGLGLVLLRGKSLFSRLSGREQS